MSRIILLIVLLGASFGAAMIVMQNDMDSLRPRPFQSHEEMRKDLRDKQAEKITAKQVEAFKSECIAEASKSEEVGRMGLNVAGFCGCMAKAHMALDLSIQEDGERRKEFYAKGKPCFEEFLKPAVIKVCNETNAQSEVKFKCKCMYAHSVREHVSLWIEGTGGNAKVLTPAEQEQRKKALGEELIKNCIE